MAIFSAAVKPAANVSANTPMLELYTGAMVVRVMEIGISQNTATACEYGLGRPAAIGVGQATTTLFQQEQSPTDPASKTNLALSWGTTAPTAPTIFMRRVSTSATIGAGVIWTFPRGLLVLNAASIVIWNITASVACNVWVVIDE
jgi:hypothetical protein